MPETLSCDERGRLLIPKGIRDELGKEFYLVKAGHELVLIPAKQDPLKDLAHMGKQAGMSKASLEQLRKAIREQAREEL